MGLPDLRTALAQWATGVVVVTTVREDGTRHGMTASSFTSVALDPPLVSVCLASAGTTCRSVRRSGTFAVNVLAYDQRDIGGRFAGMNSSAEDRFALGNWLTTGNGATVLDDAVAWLDCAVTGYHLAGDHTIVLGRVRAAATPRAAAPLIYHDRTYYEGIAR
ncbi:flavin reductase family protein [Nocardia alba]|uniref:3-hydroxy-9,10-secoandrosta-1,3,5(10)-triene-9, 17-dione monooxygenase reductase component n=1 Tax=Nocardia alba TaxID=225051 RepID=A0A4R1FTN0_9NOCA|nr:flavin reductase family protein [Nocardia alba]TCJ97112.1 3-hydroxy-9,10-secoandrosta-1,3,5(10)-triene-9,17-dione monooxygenase reductase component [Nocardia alba]